MTVSLAIAVEGESRIFRSCAITGENKCLDRTGTKEIAVKYCECFGDQCNSAPALLTTTTILISSIVSVASIIRHL